MIGIDEVIRRILERRATVPHARSLLVGLSGIDGCGKGYVARQLQAHLALYGVISAMVNVDGWLNLPEKRFNQSAPAENFYQNAIRFDEFPQRWLAPSLVRRRDFQQQIRLLLTKPSTSPHKEFI